MKRVAAGPRSESPISNSPSPEPTNHTRFPPSPQFPYLLRYLGGKLMSDRTQLPLVTRQQIERLGLIILAERHGSEPFTLTDRYLQEAFGRSQLLAKDAIQYLMQATVEDQTWCIRYEIVALRINGEAGAFCYALPRVQLASYFDQVQTTWKDYDLPSSKSTRDGYDRSGRGSFGRERRPVRYVR
jgi:hypothetical protein